VVLDSLPLGFDEESAIILVGEPHERVLDAVADAARRYLPTEAVLDFAGDVMAAIAQLEVALDVVANNEPINRKAGNIEQADLEASNAAQFRNAIHYLKAGAMLDDAGEPAGEEWETVVGTIKRGGEVIGRAVVADGDGKAMVYLGATGKQRVTFASSDGTRLRAMWSDDDAGDMIDWLVENIADAEQQAQAAIAAAAAPAPEPAPVEATTGGGAPPAEPPAAPPVQAPEPEPTPATLQQGLSALAEISVFVPRVQRKVIQSGMRGEEGQFFIDKMMELRARIMGMPKSYDTDGQGGRAIAYLHYFAAAGDWWITERDTVFDEQDQAFGLADLGQGYPEKGYISITELVNSGRVELDLHFTPKSLNEVQGIKEEEPVEKLTEDEEDPNIGRTWRSPQGVREITGFADGRYKTTIDNEPGLPIDPDDVEEEVRNDERDVAEFEKLAGDQRARDAESAAGEPALEAAGYKRVGPGVEYVRTMAPAEDGSTVRYNIRRFGEVGEPKKYRVTFTVAFSGGITGASKDVGTFDTTEQALAAVDADLAKRKPTGDNAPVNTLRPLTPQSPDRIKWEEQIARLLVEQEDIPNGDAQGMMEAKADELDVAFARGDTPAALVNLLWPAEPTGSIVEGSGVVQTAADVAAETPVAPVVDPTKDADRAYLQTLINGSADYFDEGILARIEPMFEKYAGDAEMQDLLEKAATAWSNATAAAARQALGG
jgi:hypothetical protein